jgi:serine/threonine protein phosphatase PrpC
LCLKKPDDQHENQRQKNNGLKQLIFDALCNATRPGQKCDLLTKLDNGAGGRDNVTCVVIFYSSFI